MRISDWSSDGFSSDLPLIAAHARDGRRPGEVGVDEIVHYVGAAAVLVIEHVMRDADPVGDPARIVDVLAGATRPDRESVGSGKRVSASVDLGVRRLIKKKKNNKTTTKKHK